MVMDEVKLSKYNLSERLDRYHYTLRGTQTASEGKIGKK